MITCKTKEVGCSLSYDTIYPTMGGPPSYVKLGWALTFGEHTFEAADMFFDGRALSSFVTTGGILYKVSVDKENDLVTVELAGAADDQ